MAHDVTRDDVPAAVLQLVPHLAEALAKRPEFIDALVKALTAPLLAAMDELDDAEGLLPDVDEEE